MTVLFCALKLILKEHKFAKNLAFLKKKIAYYGKKEYTVLCDLHNIKRFMYGLRYKDGD